MIICSLFEEVWRQNLRVSPFSFTISVFWVLLNALLPILVHETFGCKDKAMIVKYLTQGPKCPTGTRTHNLLITWELESSALNRSAMIIFGFFPQFLFKLFKVFWNKNEPQKTQSCCLIVYFKVTVNNTHCKLAIFTHLKK